MTPRVSVVIPTWNRCGLVLECLASLQAQDVEMEIVVVDDGSTDNTAQQVSERVPQVRLVQMAHNSGFAKAANAGIRAAHADWVLLLNNDVTLAPDCLPRMLAAAEREHADMVAPLLLWRDEPEKVYSAGDRIGINGRPEAIGFREDMATLLAQPLEPPFGISAACGLYHRRVLDRVGLMEESFVAYFEDADLAFRARLGGFKPMVETGAVAYHIGSASIAGNTWWRSAQCYRNHALLLLRCMPWRLITRYWRSILRERRHQRRMMFSAARAQHGTARALWVCAKYMAWLCASAPRAMMQRARIQALRQVDVDAVDSLLGR